ncbi:MAG: hypothetical protein HPY57_15010 [Ignavibacteria bacterium]|nr:hypothetical protein [Ignavibacteria bacterium]
MKISWYFTVKGENDRLETWMTTSQILSNVAQGDTLDAENYSFVEKK